MEPVLHHEPIGWEAAAGAVPFSSVRSTVETNDASGRRFFVSCRAKLRVGTRAGIGNSIRRPWAGSARHSVSAAQASSIDSKRSSGFFASMRRNTWLSRTLVSSPEATKSGISPAWCAMIFSTTVSPAKTGTP